MQIHRKNEEQTIYWLRYRGGIARWRNRVLPFCLWQTPARTQEGLPHPSPNRWFYGRAPVAIITDPSEVIVRATGNAPAHPIVMPDYVRFISEPTTEEIIAHYLGRFDDFAQGPIYLAVAITLVVGLGKYFASKMGFFFGWGLAIFVVFCTLPFSLGIVYMAWSLVINIISVVCVLLLRGIRKLFQ